MRLRIRRDRGERIRPGRKLKIDPRCHERAHEGVNMALDKPGHEHPPGEVDHLGLRSAEREDFRVRANGDDPLASNRDGLRPRLPGVERVDLPVVEDHRCAICLGRRSGGGA
jgi:hypothetical protein